MNILLISPGVSKKYNDNYHAYAHMCDMGNSILAITQKQNLNKAGKSELSPYFDHEKNFTIYRVFENLKQQKSIFHTFIVLFKSRKIIYNFKPDIIFCEELGNLFLAVLVKIIFKIPIVLRVEFAFDRNYPYRSMGRFLKFFKNRVTGDFFSIQLGGFIWKLATKYSNAVISCYYGDKTEFTRLGRSNFYYIPWPTAHPQIIDGFCRVRSRAIFVGSFDQHKNIQEFEKTLPLLFAGSPIKEFLIIGDGEYSYIIDNLKKIYPNQITHIKSLPRSDCLNMIGNSCFAYSPAIRGGWGFIGDSWAMKTPVVVTHNHYNFCNDIDSIVTDSNEIVYRVNELLNNDKYYDDISNGGYARFLKYHTAESVGENFHNICLRVINN